MVELAVRGIGRKGEDTALFLEAPKKIDGGHTFANRDDGLIVAEKSIILAIILNIITTITTRISK